MAKLEDILSQGDPRRKEIQSVQREVSNFHIGNFDPPLPEELITLGGSSGLAEWFTLSLTKLLSHTLMIGGSGSGKSQMLLRIAYEILFNEDRELRLYIVDGKGDPKFAETIAAMAHAAGKPPVPIVRLGWGPGSPPSAVFDGFADAEDWDICNRLEFLYDLKKKNAESDWYIVQQTAILKLICGVESEYNYGVKVDPPRNFDELGDRIDYDWLEATYKGTGAMRIIKAFSKEIPNFYAKTMSLISGIAPLVAEGGFRLSEHPVVIFSVNYDARREDAGVLFRFLGGCIGSHISNQNRTHKEFWMIDEFGKFGAEIIASVILQARSKLLGIIIAMQTIASLGENFQYAEEIKSGTATQILMRTNNAGDLIERAGMKKVADISVNTKNGEESFTRRWKEVFRVDPTELSGLEDGEAFVVQGKSIGRIMGRLVKDYDASMFDENIMEDLTKRKDIIHQERWKRFAAKDNGNNPNVTPP